MVATGKVNHDQVVQLAEDRLKKFSSYENDQNEDAQYTGGVNLIGRDLEPVLFLAISPVFLARVHRR